MMKMIVTIGRDGRTSIRVEGAVGEQCLTFTKAIEQALGVVEARKTLPELEQSELSVSTDINVSGEDER